MAKTLKVSIPLLGLTYIVIFASWFLYRYFTHFSDVVDELIIKPIVWITPVIIISFWKKISFNELGLKNLTGRFLLLSIISGIGLTALQFIPIYLQNHKPLFIPSNFIVLTVATIGTALSEEILFRGFFFKEFQKYYSSTMSNGIVSLLFALMHIPIFIVIQHLTGTSLLVSLYITFASSVVFCLLYNYTKNLWTPIIAHFILDVLLLIF